MKAVMSLAYCSASKYHNCKVREVCVLVTVAYGGQGFIYACALQKMFFRAWESSVAIVKLVFVFYVDEFPESDWSWVF